MSNKTQQYRLNFYPAQGTKGDCCERTLLIRLPAGWHKKHGVILFENQPYVVQAFKVMRSPTVVEVKLRRCFVSDIFVVSGVEESSDAI